MSQNINMADDDKFRKIVTDSMSYRMEREKTYRERALKMFPNICGWCGREFSGARIKELTVHHKDFNHDNNPANGSNWELLCIYCHEQMHAQKSPLGDGTESRNQPSSTHQPFANLKDLLNIGEDEPHAD